MARPRLLGIIWLIASLPVGFFGIVIIGLSGMTEGTAGIVLVILAALAVLVGVALLIAKPNRRVLSASGALSVLWLFGSIFTTISFDFPEDRWLGGGLPAAVGLLTAVLALRAGNRAKLGS